MQFWVPPFLFDFGYHLEDYEKCHDSFFSSDNEPIWILRAYEIREDLRDLGSVFGQ